MGGWGGWGGVKMEACECSGGNGAGNEALTTNKLCLCLDKSLFRP